VLESDELQLANSTEEILGAWGGQVRRESDLLHSVQNEIWILDLRLNYPNWIFWIWNWI